MYEQLDGKKELNQCYYFEPTRVKAPKSPQAPKRRSMRLQRIDPEGQPLPELPVEEPPVDEHVCISVTTLV